MNCSVKLHEENNANQITLKRKLDEYKCESEITSSSTSATSPAKKSKAWHVKLATESPARTDLDTDQEDGYSTVHDIETDECRDSDDTESLPGSEGTTAYATIDVLEYEIATTSEDETDNASFCTESSATGSDALYIQTLTNFTVQALYADTSSSGDEYIQADTEDSMIDSDSGDPELGKADYWKCVKCKNAQNNPLYRYCERCYQVRKSHFPPRPKNKKVRQRRRSFRNKPYDVKNDRKSPIITRDIDDSSSESLKSTPCKYNNNKGVKRKHEDSAGDSVSSSSDSEIEETKTVSRKRASPKRRCIRNGNARTPSMQDCASFKQNLESKLVDGCEAVIDSKSESSDLLSQLSKECTNNDTQIINPPTNLYSGTILNNHVNLAQHDSGISSQEAYSSQEYYCNPKPAMLCRINALRKIDTESSSTDDQDLIQGKNYNHLKPSPLSATSSNCSEASTESGVSMTSFKQTDVDQMLNVESNKQEQQLSSRNSVVKDDESTICSLCFDNEKSAVFVHTKKACSGCCYTCAMKTWKKYKVCPFCKEKAKNVIKLYSH